VSSEAEFQKLLGELQASLDAQAAIVHRDDLFKIPNIMVLEISNLRFTGNQRHSACCRWICGRKPIAMLGSQLASLLRD
jgi:hypothetical protein